MMPYQETVSLLKDQFHVIYVKAGKDHTVRTDVTEVRLCMKKPDILRISSDFRLCKSRLYVNVL